MNVAEALTVDHDEEYHEPAGKAMEVRKERRELANAPSVAMTPMEMLNHAVESGQGIDVIGKLMDLQERWEKNQGRKAFDAAVAEAKAQIPPVAKNATGHNNKRYADFSAYARVVDPIIARYGLSYRFRTVQDERIHVTCILSHRDGYSEENTLSGPADSSGSKNAIQAIGSTLTYLQRYTLVQALGLAASEDDDGKVAGRSEEEAARISPAQLTRLRALLEDTNSDVEKFCEIGKLEALPDMLAIDFDDAVRMLEQKKRKMAESAR